MGLPQYRLRTLIIVVAAVAVTLTVVAKLAKWIMATRDIYIHDTYISVGGYTITL